jgi:hypothetical protein
MADRQEGPAPPLDQPPPQAQGPREEIQTDVHEDERLKHVERLPRRGDQEVPPGKDVSI